MAAVVWLVLDVIERRRFRAAARPVAAADRRRAHWRWRRRSSGRRSRPVVVVGLRARCCRRVVADTNLDLLHFSLHPVSGGRLAVEFALVLLHAAVIWGAAAIIRLPATLLRAPRGWSWRATAAGGWLAGAPSRPWSRGWSALPCLSARCGSRC